MCVYLPDCSSMTVWLSPHATCCAGPGSGTSSLTGCPLQGRGRGRGRGREKEEESEREGERGQAEGGREREREGEGEGEGGGRELVQQWPVFSVALA